MKEMKKKKWKQQTEKWRKNKLFRLNAWQIIQELRQNGKMVRFDGCLSREKTRKQRVGFG